MKNCFISALKVSALSTVLLTASMILGGGEKAAASCAAPETPYNFAALWQNGTHANYIDVGISSQNFASIAARRRNQNLVLDDVEYTWDAEDSRMEWSVSWVRGPQPGTLRTNNNIRNFVERNEAMERRGQRLIDIEYSIRKGQWIGLWREGNHSVEMKTSLTRNELVRYANQMHREGWRLFDLEKTSATTWTALWRDDDSRANYFNVDITGEEITQLTAERVRRGLTLVDIEAYRGQRGERLFAGIWTTGARTAQSIAGIHQGELNQLLSQRHRNGYRLIDIEAYEPNAVGERGDIGCNDVIYNPVE